jgi:hypothetical protein
LRAISYFRKEKLFMPSGNNNIYDYDQAIANAWNQLVPEPPQTAIRPVAQPGQPLQRPVQEGEPLPEELYVVTDESIPYGADGVWLQAFRSINHISEGRRVGIYARKDIKQVVVERKLV